MALIPYFCVPRKCAIYSIHVVYKTWNYGSHTFLSCSEQWLDIWFSREPGDEWSIVNMCIKFAKVCLGVPRKCAIYSIPVVYKTWNYGSHTFLLCCEQWFNIWFGRESPDERAIVNMWLYETMINLNPNLDRKLAFKFIHKPQKNPYDKRK